MNKKTTLLLGFSAFLLFIVCASIAFNYLSDNTAPPEILQPPPAVNNPSSATQPSDTTDTPKDTQADERTFAPDFTAEDWDGNEIRLSDFFGTPIVLNFWASWCPPCKQEMPDFDTVYMDLGDEVAFVMVCLADGVRETKDTGKKYITAQGYSFPVYFDLTREAGIAYGVTSIPTTVFIDRDGVIVTFAQGAIDEGTLRRGIEMIWK